MNREDRRSGVTPIVGLERQNPTTPPRGLIMREYVEHVKSRRGNPAKQGRRCKGTAYVERHR